MSQGLIGRFSDRLQAEAVDEFQGAGRHPGFEQHGHHLAGGPDVRKTHGQSLEGFRQGYQPDNGFGDNAQSAFRSRKQFGHGISHHIFEAFGSQRDQPSVRKHHLQAQDIPLGDPVFGGPHASGVFRNIAADGGNPALAGSGG